jgi:hypothetical protein
MFVVVDTDTKCKVVHPRTRKETYLSERAAKAALTRINKLLHTQGEFVVMDVSTYNAQVPMREVINLMTGKPVLERADTPWSCSVASESYWSS